jgi:hypothetical protein
VYSETIAILAGPQKLTWRIDPGNSSLQAGWAPVPGSKCYHAQLLSDGKVFLEKKNLPANAPGWNIPLDLIFQTGGPFSFRVMASAADPSFVDSAYAAFPGPPIARSAAPCDLTLTIDPVNSRLMAKWTNAPKNNGYHVEFSSGDTVCIQNIIAKDTNRFAIHYQQLIRRNAQPGPFKMRLFARSSDPAMLDSLFSDFSTPLIERYAAPASVSMTWNAAQMTLAVSWKSPARSSHVRVILKEDINGKPVASKEAIAAIGIVSFGPQDFAVEKNMQYFAELQDTGDGKFMPSMYVNSEDIGLSAPGPATNMVIISGDKQNVSRINVANVPGGIAHFAPLQVLVTDRHDIPVGGTAVSFSVTTHPPGMTVQIKQAEEGPVVIYTGIDGLATLNALQGDSVHCYDSDGPLIVQAEAIGKTLSFNLTVARTSPPPGARLIIRSGNNQVLNIMPKDLNDGAKFQPLIVKLITADDEPLKNIWVNFKIESKPLLFGFTIDPLKGGDFYDTLTGEDGIAVLNGLTTYFSPGIFRVMASVEDGPIVQFNCKVTVRAY